MKDQNNREIEIESIDGEIGDAIEFSGCYADSPEEELSDESYEYIYKNYSGELEMLLLEKSIMKAEDLMDMLKDGD